MSRRRRCFFPEDKGALSLRVIHVVPAQADAMWLGGIATGLTTKGNSSSWVARVTGLQGVSIWTKSCALPCELRAISTHVDRWTRTVVTNDGRNRLADDKHQPLVHASPGLAFPAATFVC